MKKYRDHEYKKHSESSNLSSVVIGMVIGAAAVYLLTNKDAKKVLEVLQKEGSKLLDEIAEKTQEVKEEVVEKIETTPMAEIKEELVEKIEDLPQHIDKVQKKGRHFFFQKQHIHES